MSDPKVNIIVCTYYKARLLAGCLESLANQTADRALYSVTIVDNNSSDGTREVAIRYKDVLPGFHYVFESKQGLSHARNRGLREARTDWVAFVDDDARATENYIERMIDLIENHGFDCFGGPCIPLFDGKPSWYLESYGDTRWKADRIGELPVHLFVDGFSCVFRKRVLEDIGGFAGSIGMSGGKIAYGEETLAQIRIRAKGGKIGFDPQMLVYHYVDKHKLRFSWFFKSAYANGRDSWETYEVDVTVPETLKAFASMLILPLFVLPKAMRSFFADGRHIQNLLIVLFVPSSVSMGKFVRGMGRLIRRK
jgi:glucosyl-dolichyl phosphate glucuronosyltransferase